MQPQELLARTARARVRRHFRRARIGAWPVEAVEQVVHDREAVPAPNDHDMPAPATPSQAEWTHFLFVM
jgi:hypothetical protein